MERDLLTSDAFYLLRRSLEVYEEVIKLAQSGDEEARGMLISFNEGLEVFLRSEYEDLKTHLKFLHPSAKEAEVVKACVSAFSDFLDTLKGVYGRIVEARNSLTFVQEHNK